VRKLIRLIQLEEIAERIMHEGLVPDARDERDPVHLDALPLQVGDHGIDVVDSDCEVVRTGRVGIGFHEMNLLAAGIEPASRVKIGARQLRHAEHVAIEGERFCVSATQMATRCTSGRRGRARLSWSIGGQSAADPARLSRESVRRRRVRGACRVSALRMLPRLCRVPGNRGSLVCGSPSASGRCAQCDSWQPHSQRWV
jgi:hypothetical protein